MSAMAGDVTAKAGQHWDKLESIFEQRTAKAMNKLGVPTAKDVDALIKRVDELAAAVARLSKTAPAKKTAARPRPSLPPRRRRRRPAPARQAAQDGRLSVLAALQPRIGLALAGGGPLGAIYEIGALCALQEALDGVDFNDLSGYVGVSAGGFIAAGLANGMTPKQLCSAFIENDSAERRPDPALAVHPPGLGRVRAPRRRAAGLVRAGQPALPVQAPIAARRPSRSWAVRCPPACSVTRRWKRRCAACSARPGAATTSAR